MVGVDLGHRGHDCLDHVDHATGVQPHVRVDIAFEDLAVDLTLGSGELRVHGQQLHFVEQIDHGGVVAGLGCRLFDLGLEAAPDQEHRVGIADGFGLAATELEVMGALPRRGYADDLNEVTPYPTGDLLDRVERRSHRQAVAARSGRVGVVTATGEERSSEEHGERQPAE